MNNRTITDDYTAKSWKAGDKLLASDLTKMSVALDAVENELVDVTNTTIPGIATRLDTAEATIGSLQTTVGAIDVPPGQTVTQYVDQKVADLVGTAPETLDTIAEVAAAIETNGDAIEAIQSLVTENGTAIDGVQTTVEDLGARTETLEQTAVKFTEFQRDQDETVRKTIQLDNFDSISGVTTTGAGVNLAMVSKWDKADFGSAQIPLNLNSKDGVVTINDGAQVATVGDLPDLSGYVKVDEINAKLDEKADKSELPDLTPYATTASVDEKLAEKQPVGDYPVYQKFVAGADPAERKTIQLANADSISGVASTGGGANLIMMSKWDKVDIGSVNYQMNLNSPSGVIQINDEKVVATTDQIPDVSILASKTELNEAIEAVKQTIPDHSQFVTNDVYNEDKAGLQTAIDSKQPAGDYALNSALEPLATKEAVAGLKVVDLGTFEKVENASYAAGADGVYNNKEAVVLTFDTAEGSGVIFNTMTAANSSAQRMYWNNQVLSRTVTDGSGTGWGVLSNFTELQNRAIKSTLFTLTTDADSETIKAAMTNENSKTITASDLDSCLKYGYTIRDYALQSGSIFVGWTGNAYTLTYIGFASPTSEPYVMSVVVNVTPQGEYSIVRNGTRGQILTSTNLASNKTFKELSDSVAGKAEVVHTHAISDVTGLQDALDGKQAAGEYLTVEDLPDTSNFATKDEVTAVEQKIPNVEQFATTEALTSGLAGKQDKGDYALKSEIPDVSGFATTETVNAELAKKIEQPVIDKIYSTLGEMNTNTGTALASKVDWDQTKKVISLPVDGSISAMREADPQPGTVPEGGVLLAQRTYDEGVTLVTEVGTTKNKLTLNASERPQIDIAGGGSEKVAYQSDLPVRVTVPVHTSIGGLQDQLYSEAEIFGWFGVADIEHFNELATSTKSVWIGYTVDASFQKSAYRYLVNYMEYVPASKSIKVIWIGPDSLNSDVISKFVLTANLDQTIIEGNSNVKLAITSLE